MFALLSAALAAPVTRFDPIVALQGGYVYNSDDDPLASAPTVIGRVGLQFAALDVELGFLGYGGIVRGSAWPFSLLSPRLEGLWHPDHKLRVDPFVAAGVGYRYWRIDDGTSDRHRARADLGITVDPIFDFLVTAGGGATAQVWGPVHVRADARATLSVSGVTAPFALGVEGVLGVEYRGEGPLDRDRDGVADRADRCPDSLEDLDAFDDQDGCLDPDDDRDGLPDVTDRCKDLAEDRDGWEDGDGCPDTNNDADKQPDTTDRCPNEAESDNLWMDQDGCPDEMPADLAAVLGEVPGIRFQGETWVAGTEGALARIADALRAHPEVRLTIGVHTDDDVASGDPRRRTDGRAAQLRAWLGGQGVAEERVEIQSFGLSRLHYDCAVAESCARNERFEVAILP